MTSRSKAPRHIRRLSVTEYAKEQGVHRNAILYRIRKDVLPAGTTAEKIGATWVIVQRVTAMLLLAAVFTGCGITGKAKRRNATDSTASERTTITRTIDTTIHVQGDTTAAEKPAAPILQGTDSLVIETPGVRVVVKAGSAGNIRAQVAEKPRSIKVKRTETINTSKKVSMQRKNAIKESGPPLYYIIFPLIALAGLVLVYIDRTFLRQEGRK